MAWLSAKKAGRQLSWLPRVSTLSSRRAALPSRRLVGRDGVQMGDSIGEKRREQHVREFRRLELARRDLVDHVIGGHVGEQRLQDARLDVRSLCEVGGAGRLFSAGGEGLEEPMFLRYAGGNQGKRLVQAGQRPCYSKEREVVQLNKQGAGKPRMGPRATPQPFGPAG